MVRKVITPFLAAALLIPGVPPVYAEENGQEFNTENESGTLIIGEGESADVVITGLAEDRIYSFGNLEDYLEYIEVSSEEFTEAENTFTVTMLKEPEEEIILQLVDENETEVSELHLLAAPLTYEVTVNGTVLKAFEEGEEVKVTAEEIDGKRFTGWKSSDSSITGLNSAELSFKMPAHAVELTSEYANLYSVTVNDGTASVTEAAPGDKVTITADDDIDFVYWNGTDSLKFDRENASTSFTMPDGSVTLTAAGIAPGWQYISNKWYYYDSHGNPLSGWQLISGKWYYLEKNGAMVTGWKAVSGKWYYLSPSGEMVSGWQKISGKWYFFNSSGAMVTGWKAVSGKWYYFNSSGAMMTGWVKSNNKWYYMNTSGAMTTGWQKVSGKWYYLNPSSGAMVTGWKEISGKWYYFTSSGAMKTGWLKNNNKWYLLSSSGAMLTGWQKVSGKWYYLNPSSGAMVTGWREISGDWYYMKSSGAMAVGWLKDRGTWYYTNASGVMVTGWMKQSGKWYYLDESSGAMATGWKGINGKWYWFNDSGAMRSGWLSLSGHWYWLNPAGDMAVGWKTINGTRYYFDNKSGDMARGIVYIGGVYYNFSQNGAYLGRPSGVPSMVSDYAYAENADGHVPLISKNADQKMWPASMTKMMTMILAIENLDNLDQRIYVTYDMIHDLDGLGLTQAGYQPGDRPTYRDLLYAACLPSAADATNILAYAVAGDPDTFVDMMNEKAAELGMINTHFANNHGDDNPQNYSTCRDMARLIAYGAENAMFRKVIGTYDYRTTAVASHSNGIYLRSIVWIYCKGYGTTYQYEIPGLLGGKSGYTPDAAYTLAVISENNGKRQVFVTAHSWVRRYYPSHVEDASQMALYLQNK